MPFTTITISTFGGPLDIKGTIVGEETHGFDYPSGSWGLYNCDGIEGATPAEFLIFREYRKRIPIRINKNRILKIVGEHNKKKDLI